MRRYIWAATWQNQQNDCAPSKDSDQPGHPPSLIRVFAVRMKKPLALSYLLSAQRRLYNQTGRMHRLIWVFAGRTCHFVFFCRVVAHMWHTKPQKRTYQNKDDTHLRENLTYIQGSHVTRKLVFGVCDQLRLKPALSNRDKLESWNFGYRNKMHYTIYVANNKGADLTARMRRLICTFVVRIWLKQAFSWRGSMSYRCYRKKKMPLVYMQKQNGWTKTPIE